MVLVPLLLATFLYALLLFVDEYKTKNKEWQSLVLLPSCICARHDPQTACAVPHVRACRAPDAVQGYDVNWHISDLLKTQTGRKTTERKTNKATN